MIKIEIHGLEQMKRDLEKLQQVLRNMDGELTNIQFDPQSPESIENAIQSANRMIEQKMDGNSSNPFVEELRNSTKEQIRDIIIKKAAEARLKLSEDL